MSDETKSETTTKAAEEAAALADLRRSIHNGRLTFQIDGRDFVFRVPEQGDRVALEGCLPILPHEEGAPPIDLTDVVKNTGDHADAVRRAEELLTYLAISPRFVGRYKPDLEPDEAPINAIPEAARVVCAVSLMGASRAYAGVSFSIRPTSGDGSSANSTPSRSGTAASQASSSSDSKCATCPELSA